ncbi:tetratricopeptide repeat protein 24-like [Acipenser ruthenus]|uniref:tetratricopeptide repeat protein 24-like n=1 Tax=Acipenser ruthenus TaxID=7906 RepID=UPI0027423D17|nr:tetratricopeptide repeat protein 24-like [Acipenser ruthenus]
MASKVTMNSSGETEAAAILADIEKLTKSGSQVLADDHHERALSIFKKAYLLSLKLPEGQAQKACLFNLGAAYIAVGKAKKGLKCLMKCKLKEPEGRDADMYFNIGIAYEEMKEYSKAVKFYQKAVNDYGAHQADNTADALIKLAYCSVNLKDPASAAHSFRLAGQSYQQAGRWDYAAMALRECASYMIHSQKFSKAGVQQVLKECHQICKGISHSSLKGKLLNDIDLHYTELKSFNQAEECFTEALGSCSGMSFSIRKRAVLLQNTGAIHNAMNQYETSLKYHAEAADMYGEI